MKAITKSMTKRLVAVFMICCMLFCELGAMPMARVHAATELDLLLNQYTSDLYIYNYICYTTPAGETQTTSGNAVFSLKGASGYNLYIGDVAGTEGTMRPLDSNIEIALNGVTLAAGKKLTVSPVNGGARTINASVTAASTIDNVTLKAGARLNLDLSADITVNTVILEEGSSLTVNTNGNTVNMPSVTGSGTLNISGGGRVNTSEVAVDNLVLSNAAVNGGGSGSVTAKSSITVNGATLQSLALFGYGAETEGEKSIAFNGAVFSEVAVAGVAPNASATVTFSGFDTISSSYNTEFIFDYTLSYKAGEALLTPLATWPTAYRVKHTSLLLDGTEVLGYIAGNTFYASTNVPLPNYDTAFYGYDGWELNGAKITELSPSQNGNVSLVAVLQAGTVTVENDLGYTPATNTNDLPLPDRVYTTTAAIDSAALTLETPYRFGYVFKGWKVVSGTLNGIHYDSYTITTEDLDPGAVTGTYSLKMEAQWEKDKFPLRLILSKTVDTANTLISFNGGESFAALGDLTSALPAGVTYDNGTFSFSNYIEYGETLESYFTRIFGGFPILKDGTDAYTFASWTNPSNGAVIASGDAYAHGGGFLVRPAGGTLAEWQDDLKKNPMQLLSFWVETTYEYTISATALADWTILVNGYPKTPDANGNITATVGEQISLCSPVDSVYNLTHWKIKGVDEVTERSFAEGDEYYYYDFFMPANDVAVSFTERNTSAKGNLTVDLFLGSVTFAENITHNNRTVSGFYYGSKEADMTPLFQSAEGYFYVWDFAEPFWATTSNATNNQLTVVSKMAGGIYLYNCELTPTDAYVAHASGRKLNGKLIEAGTQGAPSTLSEGMDWSAYGNIVIDNSVNIAYDTYIYLRGTNTVASVTTGEYRTAASYAGHLYLYGENSSSSFLTLGSVIYVGYVYLQNLTVNQYDDDFEYLIYTVIGQINNDTISIRNCNVSAVKKRLYNSSNYIDVYSSQLDVGSIFVGYALRIHDGSYIRVRGDVIGHYYCIEMDGNASAVIDGGVYTRSYASSYGYGSLNKLASGNSGYLLVKGVGIIGTQLNVQSNSVVVANAISASKGSEFSQGVVVANHIINPSTHVPYIDSNGYYTIAPHNSSSARTNDPYPFYTYDNRDVACTLSFSGSSVYLFGYHSSNTGIYDAESNLITDTNNPVKAILDTLLDANGDLRADLRAAATADTATVAAAAEAAVGEAIANNTYADKECFAVGNSTHTASTSYEKKVSVSGGKIYAAGNISFFNETTVTGGTVICGGSFSSKHDLYISGGSITAKEIGISNILTETKNGFERYALLSLKGGEIKADLIGTLSAAPGNIVTPKGAIDLAITSAVTPYSLSETVISGSLLANYFYDKNVFTASAEIPKDIDFSGVYRDGAAADITMTGETALIPPSLKAGGDAMWLYDDANGSQITKIDAAGLVNGDTELNRYVYTDRSYLALYAAKSSYALSIKGDYVSSGFTVTSGSKTYTKNTVDEALIGSTITVTLDNTDIFDRTVIWYTDAAGILHNVMAADSTSADRISRTITFKMPYADTEIWITNELTLYLDMYDISFNESGFALEENTDSRRADSVFAYAGDIRIAQKNSTIQTFNRIFFETAASGNVSTLARASAIERKITLTNLNQNTRGTLNGTMVADGAQVRFTVDHTDAVKIAPVDLPLNAALTFTGADSANKNILHFYTHLSLDTYRCVGNSGKVGTVHYENLDIQVSGYHNLGHSTTKSPSTVSFKNCIIALTGTSTYYTRASMVKNVTNVIFEDCVLILPGSPDLSSPIVTGCTNLDIINSTITLTMGGTRNGVHPFSGASGITRIDNSTISISYNRSATKAYLESAKAYGKLVLTGNSTVTVGERFILLSLELNDSSSFIADNGNGTLFCPDITVNDSATLNAGRIFLSGYAVSEFATKTAAMTALTSGNVVNGASSGGLTVNGGTVTASSFVGGDRNAKITVNGGTLNTAAMGTLGAYVGFDRNIPKTVPNPEFTYEYSIIPAAGTVVNINGGEVNITDGGYIGGMNTKVNISGGEVNLGSGAVLGLTEEQKTRLYNDASSKGKELENAVDVNITGGTVSGSTLSVPYGTLDISDTASVNAVKILGENGTVTINKTSPTYDNTYSGTIEHNKVGVYVSDAIDAKNIYINGGAIVFANKVYTTAGAGIVGALEVSENAHLYVGAEYGTKGDGRSDITELTEGKIHGLIRYKILYELGGNLVDPATNGAGNPSDYVPGKGTIDLADPTRSGYEFAGWYNDSTFSGEPFYSISTAAESDRTVYAKWTPKKVIFTIIVDHDKIGVTPEVLKQETADHGIAGTLASDNTSFTFARTVEIPYLESILGDGAGHINTKDYLLRSYSIVELVFNDTTDTLNRGSTVTKEMVNSGSVILRVASATKTRRQITLDLNLTNGLPKGVDFNNTSAPETMGSTYMSSHVDIGDPLSKALGFVAGGSIVAPSAPGYVFAGWYDNREFTGDPINASLIISNSTSERFYAKWTAKEYYLTFDAGNNSELNEHNRITLDKTAPENSSTQYEFVVKVTYDKPISSAVITHRLMGGSYEEISGTLTALPHAWMQGHTHNGKWYFTDGSGEKHELPISTVFNLTNVNTGTAWDGNSVNAGDPVSAVTVLPYTERVKIVYHTNGGILADVNGTPEWKNAYGSFEETSVITIESDDPSDALRIYRAQAAKYPNALLGYRGTEVASTSDFTVTGTVTDPLGNVYSVISTTAEYFAANGRSYIGSDYRFEISKKGYTFLGWRIVTENGDGTLTPVKKDGNDVYIGFFPQYEDITVEAVWEENEYFLTLKPKSESMTYAYTDFNASGDVVVSGIKVSSEIKDIPNWPGRDKDSSWFAYNRDHSGTLDENNKRYLLGFTFDPLDPGSSDSTNTEGYAIYKNYAEAVTILINSGNVFSHSNKTTVGTLFDIPYDSEYIDPNITGQNSVPDYPTGSNVVMYAVYRERSLVFVEYYKTGTGEEKQRTLASYPWTDWVDFDPLYRADSYEKPDELSEGYYLLQWTVNGHNINDEMMKYPNSSDIYNDRLASYKNYAEDVTGTYDIMVYTAYIPQVTENNVVLEAGSDPRITEGTYKEYIIPDSMQEGQLNYSFEGLGGITLVDKDELDSLRFTGSSANNVFAIQAALYNKNGDLIGTKWLDNATTSELLFGSTSVASGWKIVLRLYHSSVMSENANNSFTLTLGYENTGLEYQKIIFKDMAIKTTPSLYDVLYQVETPAGATVTDYKGFDPSGKTLLVQNLPYGSRLLSALPIVEGYAPNGMWTNGTENKAYDTPFIFDGAAKTAVTGGNVLIVLTSGYGIRSFELTADSELLGYWDITYNGGTAFTGSATLSYGTQISFTPKYPDEYPEFVLLNKNGIADSLYDIDPNAPYTVTMPAADVHASIRHILDLYLENGSIYISPDGYIQGSSALTWRGAYNLLMDGTNNTDGSSTENTLTLAGDLRGRDITLGNLNVTASDSIALENGAKATLSTEYTSGGSSITAKNILVPEGAELEMSGKGALVLTPSAGSAAIGGKDAPNGVILLDNISVTMNLTPSLSSGIGPGNQTCGGASITLNNCSVSVKETATHEIFRGAWIGGAGADKVNITSTDISLLEGSHVMLYGPAVVNGDKVYLDGCNIGTSAAPVTDPLMAGELLDIKDSVIYQHISQGTAIQANASGSIKVTDSTVIAVVDKYDELYVGKMMLLDAQSHVVIANVKIMETAHGNIDITAQKAIQNSVEAEHNRSYLILHELDYGTAPDLTVGSVANAANITLKGVELADLTVSTDLNTVIEDSVTVNGTVTVANGKTLTATAADSSVFAINGGFAETTGSYSQTGGTLTSTGDIAVGKDLYLKDVTANVSGKIGSLGLGGVTSVTLINSTVTADTAGALGAHNTTFTLVNASGSAVNGKLVRDHYRLTYVTESGYNTSALDTVLRSVTEGSTVTYTPSIPAAPTASGASSFRFWYIKTDGSSIKALGDQGTLVGSVPGLTDTLIVYASPSGDGTSTLTLYAFMGARISAIIEAGKLLNNSEFTGSGITVTVNPAGKATVRFEIAGSAIAGSDHIISVDTPFVAGTKLTLGIISNSVPTFYYYICGGSETEISFSSFKKMGTASAATDILQKATGDVLDETVILCIDTTSAENAAELTKTVGLLIKANGSEIASASVSHATSKEDTLTADAEKVTVSHIGDAQFGKRPVYLVATFEVIPEDIPYTAIMTLNGFTGERLNGKQWAFEIGSAAATINGEFLFEHGKLPGGQYSVTWTMVIGEGSDGFDPLGNDVASAGVRFTVEKTVIPQLEAQLISIDGEATEKRTLTAGESHTLEFEATSSLPITVIVEAETDNGYFEVEDAACTESEAGMTVSLGSTLAPGLYRIRFAMITSDSGAISDSNVSFTFYIE